MLSRCSMIALASLLHCVPALADTPSPPTSTSRVPNLNDKVCADIIVTGSRIAKKRICATRAEWETMKQADKDLVNEIQRSPNVGCAVINTHTPTPTCS